MSVYNKLKIAILTIISSQTISAITLSPIQIQSNSGDLLYAEMKFSNSNPNEKIEVGLAETNDLSNMGISHQPPGHLNFFTRRSADGTGVIVITSSRPVLDSELNILIKIKEGNASRIQQIKTPLSGSKIKNQVKASSTEKTLKPQVIVSEKDIALNLPTSTQYQTNSRIPKSTQTPLVISSSAPPALSIVQSSANKQTTPQKTLTSTSSLTRNQVPKINTTAQQQDKAIKQQSTPTLNLSPIKSQIAPVANINKSVPIKNVATVTANKVKVDTENSTKATAHKKIASNTPKTTKVNTTKTQKKIDQPILQQAQPSTAINQQHVVQANESLWKIAAKIAAETQQYIPAIMQQIKKNNQHAFIQGNINRMRQGSILNLNTVAVPIQQDQANSPTKASLQEKPSTTTKYRLNQAVMSLTTDSQQRAKSSQSNKETQQNQTNADLASKVMTAREKTVKLQNNVSQLSLALQQKDHRIQLLNARLAELQKQLRLQSRGEKSKH